MTPGEVWLARVEFSDESGAKVRPALVLWVDGEDVVVATITSSRPRTARDVALIDWKAAAMRRPSSVRLARLQTLRTERLTTALGPLTVTDRQRVQVAWETYMKLEL